jgi:hypothetical protein
MTEKEEKIFRAGYLAHALKNLNDALRDVDIYLPEGHIENPNALIAQLTSERLGAIQALRKTCEYFGDNDWEPNLHLADIIEKHLYRYLEEKNDIK